MKACPFCAEQIQDDAIKCRFCGEFIDGSSSRLTGFTLYPRMLWPGFEYRSKAELFGLPLVHIAQGIDPDKGLPRVARGVIAIGNIAVGFLTIGGLSLGFFSMGGLSLGLVVFGGVAVGGVAFGGVALGLLLAVGGLAVSLLAAVGGLALAPNIIGGNGVTPAFIEWFEQWFNFIPPN